MAKIRVVVSIFIAVLAIVIYKKVTTTLFAIPPVPHLEETWWGPRQPSEEDTEIRPFKINVSDEVLKDLEHRLSNTLPFQKPLEGAKQHYGINTNHLKNIIDFWRTKYNWREREKILNQFPQYTVSIQGLKIHYLHVQPQQRKGVKVVPLLLLHGWPGSIKEFYEIIPLLTNLQKDKSFVFEVIAPSLPGYGFSEASVRPGLGGVQLAVVFKNFMKRLGYDRYYLQGGDWGAVIVQHMATLFPDRIIGMHSNMCMVISPLANLKTIIGNFFPSLIVSKEDESKMYPLKEKYEYLLQETGYMHIQSTKPDTIGVALRDSPVGLAAYLLEKFSTWTNPAWIDLEDGGLTKKFTLPDLLDNVMIYWVTRSITTSMRLYSETFNKAQYALEVTRIPTNVPSGCAKFSYELAFQPDSILKEKLHNLVHSAVYDGGHFAVFEVPEVLSKDIYIFVDKVEKLNAEKK